MPTLPTPSAVHARNAVALAVAQGKSVVVGLLGTGEAYSAGSNTSMQDGDTASSGEMNLPPAPAAILKSLITTVSSLSMTGPAYNVLLTDRPADDPEICHLMRRIDSLSLPPNPLDEIMTRLASRGVSAGDAHRRSLAVADEARTHPRTHPRIHPPRRPKHPPTHIQGQRHRQRTETGTEIDTEQHKKRRG
eukprot:2482992-Pleurochrysis_carterae.AAC.1